MADLHKALTDLCDDYASAVLRVPISALRDLLAEHPPTPPVVDEDPDTTPTMPPETLQERLKADGRLFRAGRQEGRADRDALLAEAYERLHQVRALHKVEHRYHDGRHFDVCAHCGVLEIGDDDLGEYRETLWPCATIRILNGGEGS